MNEARQHFALKSKADWTGLGYQLANRLAWHYFLNTVNGLPSRTVMVYFTNCIEMSGPTSPEAWIKPLRYLYRRLGLPEDFHAPGVHSVFFDVSLLTDFAGTPPPPEPHPWQSRNWQPGRYRFTNRCRE